MGARDFAYDRQAQPGSIRPPGDERLEEALANIFGNARPRVADPHAKLALTTACLHRHRATRRSVLDRVQNQVIERTTHLANIKLGRHAAVLDGAALQRNALRSRKFAMRFDCSVEKRDE